MTSFDRLVWTDIETTGLEPNQGVILEIGFVITDLDLNWLDQYSQLVWDKDTYPKYWSEAPEFVKNMHYDNDLYKEAESNGQKPAWVEANMQAWLQSRGINKEDPLCGSSVHFDRKWLAAHFPDAEALFSYRNIDNSSTKELCRRYNPQIYAKLDEDTKPLKLHRVIPDLEDSINEFEYYRDNFLFWSGNED